MAALLGVFRLLMAFMVSPSPRRRAHLRFAAQHELALPGAREHPGWPHDLRLRTVAGYSFTRMPEWRNGVVAVYHDDREPAAVLPGAWHSVRPPAGSVSRDQQAATGAGAGNRCFICWICRMNAFVCGSCSR